MGIDRLVEYIAYCDQCAASEACGWKTRKEAEQAARDEGWQKIRGTWYCRECVEERNNGRREHVDFQER